MSAARRSGAQLRDGSASIVGDGRWPNALPSQHGISPSHLVDAFSPGIRVVVLDDDPTGSQVVRDVPVLTRWTDEHLDWALDADVPGFYILTNTRSLNAVDAADRNQQVALRCLAAAARHGVEVVFASRSDSTLRGHFPLEIDVLSDVLLAHGTRPDALILSPSYIDAGRVTLDGTHWLRDGEDLVPVASSEFAADATFGYRASYLPDWVEEKSGGRIRASETAVVDLDVVRRGPHEVAARLSAVPTGAVVVVDAVTDDDLRVLVAAVLDLERQGRRFIYRVGPSFVRARLGQGTHPMLDADVLSRAVGTGGGLVVVGSHTDLTTRQVRALTAARDVEVVELEVAAAIGAGGPAYLDDLATRCARVLPERTVVLMTSRDLVRGRDGAESLDVARRVSAAVTQTVRAVVQARRPSYLVAKGGITSSDIATSALDIERAWITGTVLPGVVSLWSAVDGIAPGLAYVVFAGNVGTDDSLLQVVSRLEDR